MPSRRFVLKALASALPPLGIASRQARGEATLGDDGLYHEPWFLDSFLDLKDDLETASSRGKRLAIMWELRGCPYCRETHLVNFADAAIAGYIKSNFEIVQLDLIGSRKVTDFDGSVVSEKELAERYAIRFTPTFQFFPESVDSLSGKTPAKREVARAPGYLKPAHFLAMFKFVREKGYDAGSFRDFLVRNSG